MARSPHGLGPNPTIGALAIAMGRANPHLANVTPQDIAKACRERGISLNCGRVVTDDPGVMSNLYFALARARGIETTA